MSQPGWRRTPEEFASRIEQSLPWIVDYLKRDRGPWSACEPGDVAAKVPRTPPSEPESLERVLEDLHTVIEPGLVRWDAPGWFAWFPSNAHPDAILGDLLASVTAQQGMLWASSPACTELETRMLEWLRVAMGLPDVFREGGPGGGVIQDTASSGVLACMVAARDRATGGEFTQLGGASCGGLTAYASAQAHSSVLKAAGICGLGRDNLRLVPTDLSNRMDAAALGTMMQRDVDAGLQPCFCVATVGTTGCGAIDPVQSIADVCGLHECWLHVDAAWAGTAAMAPQFQAEITDGAERADSWSFNPHKWMGAAFDCCCLWLADRGPLLAAMSIDPEYLRNAATRSGDVIDYRDWHVQLGRRFRALKLWVLLRCTGIAAIAAMVQFHVELARAVETAVISNPTLELAAPRNLSLVCLRHIDGDRETQRLLDAINDGGGLAATHCRLDGALAARIAIGTLRVDRTAVDALIAVLNRC